MTLFKVRVSHAHSFTCMTRIFTLMMPTKQLAPTRQLARPLLGTAPARDRFCFLTVTSSCDHLWTRRAGTWNVTKWVRYLKVTKMSSIYIFLKPLSFFFIATLKAIPFHSKLKFSLDNSVCFNIKKKQSKTTTHKIWNSPGWQRSKHLWPQGGLNSLSHTWPHEWGTSHGSKGGSSTFPQ